MGEVGAVNWGVVSLQTLEAEGFTAHALHAFLLDFLAGYEAPTAWPGTPLGHLSLIYERLSQILFELL